LKTQKVVLFFKILSFLTNFCIVCIGK